MHRILRFLAVFFLGAALVAPVAIRAGVQDKDERRHDDKDRKNKPNKRYYDRDRRDWHSWDDREDRAYRRWLAEERKEHRDFSKLNRKERTRYWLWRHTHPDEDRDRR